MDSRNTLAARLQAFRDSPSGTSYPRPPTRSADELRAYIAHGFRRADADSATSRLRPHQREVVAATAAHVSQGAMQTICVAPTGSGKTEVFQSLIRGACQVSPRTGRLLVPNTVILVPTQTLVRQTVERFAAHHADLPVGYLSPIHGSAFGPICVGTYQGFVQAVLEGIITPANVDHLVLDEAHRALSDLRRDIFSRFIGTSTVSAYTALPAYDLTRHLFSLLGKANTVANITIKRMIDEKVIAPIVNYVLRVRVEGELPSDDRLRGAVLSRMAAEAACGFFLEQRDELPGGPLSGKAFLGYTRGITEAHAAARIFEGWTGKRVLALSGKDGIEAQTQAVERLSGRDVTGLFNAKLLIEGTDVPGVKLVLNLAPTGSLVNQLQRCGRGIRIDPKLHPDDPAQTAAIVDIAFVVNGKQLGRPRFFFEAVGDIGLARLVDSPPAQVKDALAAITDDERSGCETEEQDGLEPEDAASEQQENPNSEADAEDESEEEISTGDGAADDAGVGDPEIAVVRRNTGGFAIRSDVEDIRYFLRNLDVQKNASWLTLTEAMGRIGTSIENTALRDIWADMAGMARDGGKVVIDGRPVRFELQRGRHGHGFPFIHIDELEWLAARAGRPLSIPFATSDWANVTRAKSLLGLDHRRLAPHWKSFAEAVGTGGIVEVPEGTLRFELRRGRTTDGHHVHIDDIPTLKRHLEAYVPPQPAPSEWLSFRRAVAALGVSRDGRIRTLWAKLIEGADKDIGHSSRAVRFERRMIGNGMNWAIHVDEMPWLKGQVLVTEQPASQTDGWLGRKAFAKHIDQSHNSRDFPSTWSKIEEELRLNGHVTIDGRPAKIEMRWNGRQRIMCIHESEGDSLRPLFGVRVADRAGDEWLSLSRLATELNVSPKSKTFEELSRHLSDLAESSNGETVYEGVRVSLKRIKKAVACVHRDSIPHVAQLLDIPWPLLQSVEPGWIGKTELSRRLGTTCVNLAFEELWNSLPRATEDMPHPVLVQRRGRAGNMDLVHERHVPVIQDMLGRRPDLPLLSEEWIPHKRADAEKEDFPGSYALLLSAYTEIRQHIDAGHPASVDGHPVRAALFRGTHKKPSVAIHVDSLPGLMAILKAKAPRHPAKTADWVSCREVGRELGIGLPAELKTMWQRLQDAATHEEGTASLDGVAVSYAYRTATHGMEVLCLSRNDLVAFGSLIEDPRTVPFKDDAWLTQTETSKRLGSRGSSQATVNGLLSGLVSVFKAKGVVRLPDGRKLAMETKRTSTKTKAICFSVESIEDLQAYIRSQSQAPKGTYGESTTAGYGATNVNGASLQRADAIPDEPEGEQYPVSEIEGGGFRP